MPILPTVDYSPILSALSQKNSAVQGGFAAQQSILSSQQGINSSLQGINASKQAINMSKQSNFAQDFKALQKKEEKRQEIVGLIEGTAKVGMQLYNVYNQAGLSKAKADAVKLDAMTRETAARNAIGGVTKFEQVYNEQGEPVMQGGQPVMKAVMPDSVLADFDSQKAAIEKEFALRPQVKEYALEQLEMRKATYNSTAVTYFDKKEQASLAETTAENYQTSLNIAIASGSIDGAIAFVESIPGTPAEKTARLDKLANDYNAGRYQAAIDEAAKIGPDAALKVANEWKKEWLTENQKSAANKERDAYQAQETTLTNELATLNSEASSGNKAQDDARQAKIEEVQQKLALLKESQDTPAKPQTKEQNQAQKARAAEKQTLRAEIESLITKGASAPEGQGEAIKNRIEAAQARLTELDAMETKPIDVVSLEAERVALEDELAANLAKPNAEDTPETKAKRAELEGRISDITKKLTNAQHIGRTHTEDEIIKGEAYAAQANARVVNEAIVYAEGKYNKDTQDPDKEVRTIADSIKNPDAREAAKQAMRKVQTGVNMERSLTTFNKDRDNGNIAELKARYEAIQFSSQFKGDEGSRSTVMGWYENLLSSITGEEYAKANAGNKASETEAQGTLTWMFHDWEVGGQTTGRDIDGAVARFLSYGTITPEQANQYWNKIATKDFPNAKSTIEIIPSIAESLSGVNKAKATKAKDASALGRLSAMESSLTAALRKELDTLGGNATAEQIGSRMESIKLAAATNEFTSVKKPFDFFGLDKNADEKAIAKAKAVMDSESGDIIIGTDVNDKINIVSSEPTKVRTVIETISTWEVGNLKSRFGVDVAASRQMPSPIDERDITGSRIYTGTDGKQYMYLSKDGKMEAYVRDKPELRWESAKQKEEFDTGADKRYPMPADIWADGIVSSASAAGARRTMPMSQSAWDKKTLKEKQETYQKYNLKAVNP